MSWRYDACRCSLLYSVEQPGVLSVYAFPSVLIFCLVMADTMLTLDRAWYIYIVTMCATPGGTCLTTQPGAHA